MHVNDFECGNLYHISQEEWDRLLLSEEEWLGRRLNKKKPSRMPALLTEDEVELLVEGSPQESSMLMAWSLQVMHDGFGAQDALAFAQMETKVLELKAHCGSILNLLQQPFPLPYFHVLVLIMWVNFFLYIFCFLNLEFIVGTRDVADPHPAALVALVCRPSRCLL